MIWVIQLIDTKFWSIIIGNDLSQRAHPVKLEIWLKGKCQQCHCNLVTNSVARCHHYVWTRILNQHYMPYKIFWFALPNWDINVLTSMYKSVNILQIQLSGSMKWHGMNAVIWWTLAHISVTFSGIQVGYWKFYRLILVWREHFISHTLMAVIQREKILLPWVILEIRITSKVP